MYYVQDTRPNITQSIHTYIHTHGKVLLLLFIIHTVEPVFDTRTLPV